MSGVKAQIAATPAGGGAFRLDQATLGIFLVDQPTHRLAIGSDRRDHRPLKAREGWIMPAGSEGLCRYDAPLEFLTVAIPDRLMTEMGGTAGFAPQVGALSALTVELAMKAPDFASQGTLFRETMERALVAQIVQTLAPEASETQALDDPRLRRAVAYITDHLAEDISLETLAHEAAMSSFHFARAFKAATGTSPLQYVIRARIETAKALLKSPALPVAEVAWRVGYGDLSRFGQHFKRHTGVTPGTYRAG
ncbi:helix-turn-helix domain-containing protein [Tabrizicola sp.]|uniref:helix-turn-helix domain-containing protein n=1 Tax=Tabrizicola sp. TaxID=2005166 RepID=UPI003F4121AC